MVTIRLAIPVLVLVLLAGCFDKANVQENPGTGEQVGGNTAPRIAGTPVTDVDPGETYSFSPTVNDPDGDTLTFSVQNLPHWAEFDAESGEITGTPSTNDVGSYPGITITVSDGRERTSLAAFTVLVGSGGVGVATLTWNPPTENTNGTALRDLAGFRVYYGQSAGQLNRVRTVSNAGASSYTVENLPPANWFFRVTAFNTAGHESTFSGMVSKRIN